MLNLKGNGTIKINRNKSK